MTPVTNYDSNDGRSSSPPTAPSSPPVAAMETDGVAPVSDTMEVEEKRMKEQTRRREAKQMQNAQAEADEEKEAKYKTLMKLVQSSKVTHRIVDKSLRAASGNPSSDDLYRYSLLFYKNAWQPRNRIINGRETRRRNG